MGSICFRPSKGAPSPGPHPIPSPAPAPSCTPTLSCSPSSHSPHPVFRLLPGSVLRALPCSFLLAPVTPPKTSYHFLLPFLGLQVHPFPFLHSDPQYLHTTTIAVERRLPVSLAGERGSLSLVHRVSQEIWEAFQDLSLPLSPPQAWWVGVCYRMKSESLSSGATPNIYRAPEHRAGPFNLA